MKALTGVVLLLLFLVELAAWAAVAVAGWSLGGPILGIALLIVVLVAWSLFASPKARYGSHGVRPAVKVLVFGGAVVLLWAAGLTGWAIALLVAAVVIHLLAAQPSVREAAANLTGSAGRPVSRG